MGLFTISPSRQSFLRLPSSPIDEEDVPFIESSQAIDVHRFERKLNILIFTTGLLSMAVISLVVVTIVTSKNAWLNHPAVVSVLQERSPF
ncbi:hypothetical protein N0V82_007535 [Gnomoniopsis sp. IMI 355080]|nr:hypothetical protein N0V82_007535 [Gnomoniopsis sp. IMI 355080]